MARKKKEDAPAPGSPAWMATFSDLMNLLLCFFVLLFSMSSVDQGKAEALVQSLANTFSRFDGGGSSFGDGNMISNGTNQLSELDNYFNSMGQTDDGDSMTNPNEDENGGDNDKQTGAEVSPVPSPGAENLTPTPVPTKVPQATLTPEEEIREENKEQSSIIYDEIQDMSSKYNLGDYVEIGIDAKEYRYVSIEIKGSLLFDSGKADLVEDAIPLISKVADMLLEYKGYRVEVIGHTDNVPQTKPPYYNNEMLSAARAITVAKYFAEDKKLGWENVQFAGRGEWEPIADNGTEEGRDKNRRVEIRLYNQMNSED